MKNPKNKPPDEILHTKLCQIYNQIKQEGKIDILGSDLEFEILPKIDNKKQRIAKLTQNKIQIRLDAVNLPTNALKYIIAHEIAHTITKKHTKKFWRTLETIYPNYQKGKQQLQKHAKLIIINFHQPK